MRKFALPRVLLCLTVFGLIAGALSSQSAPGPYEILPFEDAYIIEAWMDLLFEDNVNRADWTGWVGTTWESPNAYNGHGGTDFSLDTGTPLYAPVAGVVSEVVNNIPENNHTMNYYGNYVKIQVAGSGPSGEALDVILAHQLPQVQVSVGQNVSVGQLVGYSDNTGQSTSEHIHLESLIRGASDGICPFYHGHFKYPIMFNPSGSVQVGHVIRVTAASTPVRSDRFETSSQITTAYQNQIYFAAYGKRGFYCIFIPGSASWRTGWIRAIDAEEVFTGTVIQALPDPGLYIHDAQLQAPFAVKASPDAGAAGISQILWGGGRFVADQVQNGWYRIPVPGSASWGWVQPNARMIVYPQLHNPAINPAALPSKDFPISESFISPGPNMFGRPKYNRCFVTDFSPAAPGGDGKVLFLTDAHNYGNGYEECVTVGRINHRNYYVESRVYLDYKPGYFPKKEYHRYGIFARDDGFSSMDRTFEGKGNCYALIYDSDDGRIRAGKFVDAVVTDFLSTARYITADGWHTFRIEAENDHIRYYLNGELLIDKVDTTFISGPCGMGYSYHGSSYPAARGAAFDNFHADALGGAPTPTPTATPEPTPTPDPTPTPEPTATPATPAAPSNLIATAVSTTQINLSWQDNSSNEDQFVIERKSGTSFVVIATVPANTTTYSNTGLKKNTTYTYRVKARNAAGDSAYSNEASAKTPR